MLVFNVIAAPLLREIEPPALLVMLPVTVLALLRYMPPVIVPLLVILPPIVLPET
jgi:hypothetical protein